MPTKLKFFKVNTLPSVLTPSALYFIKNDNNGLMSLYLTDTDGTVSYRTHDSSDILGILTNYVQGLIGQPNGIAGLDANGNLIGNLISVIDGQNTDIRHNGNYVWKDLIGEFNIKNTSGANNPSWVTLFNNLQGLSFSHTSMNQVWIDFHIPHDYAVGTKVYPHIHFMPLSNKSGNVRWGIEYSIAKGHGQQAFPASTTIYVTQEVQANSRYMHFIVEVSEAQALLSNSIEPDSFIKTRIFRDASNPADTFSDTVSAWQCDLHYQAARIGTKNRSPNFFE